MTKLFSYFILTMLVAISLNANAWHISIVNATDAKVSVAPYTVRYNNSDGNNDIKDMTNVSSYGFDINGNHYNHDITSGCGNPNHLGGWFIYLNDAPVPFVVNVKQKSKSCQSSYMGYGIITSAYNLRADMGYRALMSAYNDRIYKAVVNDSKGKQMVVQVDGDSLFISD